MELLLLVPTNVFPNFVKLALTPLPENPYPLSTAWANADSVNSAKAVLPDKLLIANAGAKLVNKNALITAKLVDKNVSDALLLVLLKALLTLK